MGWPYIGTSRRGPLAAVDLVRQKFPGLKVRVINVVDLMKLQPQNHKDFDVIFTTDKPIVFAYHVCPTLIHQPTYRRTNHGNLHVRGFKEEGTTSTPFDMVVMNDLDRFHLVADVIDRVPALGARAAYAKQAIRDKLIEHKQYIAQHGEEYTGDPRLALGNTAGRRRRKQISQVLPRVCVARVYLLRRCLLRYGDIARTLATQNAGRSARGPT